MMITKVLLASIVLCTFVYAQNLAKIMSRDLSRKSSNARNPSNPTPILGTEFMLAGYDLRNASTKAIGDRVKSAIFLDTYDFKKQYTRPNTTTTYDVPDEFDAYWRSEKNVLTSSDVHHTIDEYFHQDISSFSIGIGFNLGAYGIKAAYNRSQGYVHYVYSEALQSAASGYVDRIITNFVLGPYVLFKKNPWLDQVLNMIPTCPRTDQDLAAVQLLFDTYGHVFPSGLSLGGYYKTITTVSEEILKTKDISWITQQLSLTFTYNAFELSPGIFKNKSDIHISEDFSKACRTVEFFEGGSNQNNATLSAWFDSLLEIPGIVGGAFRPLSDLITNDANKRKNIEELITKHVNTGIVGPASCAQNYPIRSTLLPPIQGYEFLGGFDSLSQSPRASLFDHTFNDASSEWDNPFYPEYRFAVPSTVGVFNNPESVDQNYTYVALSKEEYQIEIQKRVKYHSGIFSPFGSKSADMYVYQYFHDLREEVMSENMRFITWYDLELNPMVRFDALSHMNSYARIMLSRLGPDLNDAINRMNYLEYLWTYGDQVVTRVSMGARIRQKTYINKDVLKAISVSRFQEQSGWSFFGIFGSKKAFDDLQRTVSEEMKESARVEVKVDGGNVGNAFNSLKLESSGFYSFNLKDLSSNLVDWNDYVKTAKDNLEPIRYEVAPIYEFISDPVIKQNMMIMVKEYLQDKGMRHF